MPGQPFAIITYRDTGPLKSWAAVRGAQVHNARTKPIEHGVPGAPKPVHLIGTGDLVADVKARLVGAKLDPDRLRKNGVLAYEAVMTASPEFFDAGDEAARKARLDAWVKAQVEFAKARYGLHRIASMVLHLDEKTPHIHLVVVPLEVKSDKRRKDRDVRWGLVGRMISGPGQFDRLQDDYAEAMQPFGLARGVRHSGAKHEPPAIFMLRMAEQQAQLDEREAAIAKAIDDMARARVEDEARILRRQREAEDVIAKREADAAQQVADAQRMMREAEAIRAAALRMQMATDADREMVRQERAAVAADRAEAALKKADAERIADYMAAARIEIDGERQATLAVKKAADDELAAARETKARLNKGMTRVAQIYGVATDMRGRIKALPVERRPAPVVEIVRKATELEREVAKMTLLPNPGLDAATIAAYRQMRDRGMGLGR